VVPDQAPPAGLPAAKQTLTYAGRPRSPSPAAGHLAEHVAEQLKLVADALVNPLGAEITAE
jgi:2-oxoglutarate dehydrogenase E1 component